MTTKSKLNPLAIIMTIAIILFVSVLIRKQFYVDNSEEIYVPQIAKIKTPAKRSEHRVVKKETTSIASTESIEVRRERLSENMRNRLMLKTPEDVMEVILKFQELGNEEKANEYIDFLLKRFPDYKMEQ